MFIREDWHRLVRPLALLAVIGVVATWDRTSPARVEAPAAPAAEDPPAAPRLSEQQRRSANETCAQKSGREFRAWNEGNAATAEWTETAGFESHYNEKLDVCFYELTVTRHAAAGAGDEVLVRQMLFDINEKELYGEYQGPVLGGSPGAGLPKVCRMAGLYCGSRREWDVLAEPFMEPQAPMP